MVKLLSIDSLMNTIDTLSNIYDAIRIINPVTKKIYDIKSSTYELVLEDFPCYTYWNSNKICKNCVSMKAYNTEYTSIKIERKCEDTYIVMAVPIWVDNEKLILEFIKNSSNSLTLQDFESNLNLELNKQLSDAPNSMSIDLVTGANNRYYLETKLPADIYKSAVNNSTISIIMADLDDFKDINDTYGHLAGDEVLKTFTNLAKMCIREDDWIARFGGDEFIIVLNNTDALNAYKVADRIRNALEKKVISYKDKVINITASFGVYEIDLDEVLDDYRKAIEKADIELLKAKKSGKNIISTE